VVKALFVCISTFEFGFNRQAYFFRYWAWRLKTAATFSAGSGGAFSDVGKMLTHLEGAEADPRHPGNRKGSRC
jgi:hypothetical protein